MTSFLSGPQSEELLRNFALGTGRTVPALPPALAGVGTLEPDQQMLAALALLAQHECFSMPAVAPAGQDQDETIRHLHADPRPLLPDPARSALNRLLSLPDKDNMPRFADAALDRIAASGFRPHPFDLPRLHAHLQQRAADGRRDLGTAERAYLALSAGGQASISDQGFLSGEIDEETWQTFTPAPRMAFLRRLRQDDPERARTLVESCFSDEPANNRAEMVAALSVRLCEDDEGFLTRALEDRAQSVKTAAGDLLARLPGTDSYRDRLARLGEMLKLEKAGLIKRKTVLRLTLPKRKSKDRITAIDALAGLRLADIAAQTGFDIHDTPALIDADDDDLCTALIGAAMAGEAYDLAVRIASEARAGRWYDCLNDLADIMSDHPDEIVGDIMLALVARDPGVGQAGEDNWLALYRLLRSPLPDAVWRDILRTKWLKALLKQNREDKSEHCRATTRFVTLLSLLVPDSAAQDFIVAIEDVGPLATSPVRPFLHFQSTLQSAASDVGAPSESA